MLHMGLWLPPKRKPKPVVTIKKQVLLYTNYRFGKFCSILVVNWDGQNLVLVSGTKYFARQVWPSGCVKKSSQNAVFLILDWMHQHSFHKVVCLLLGIERGSIFFI